MSSLVSVIIPCYNHGKYIDEAVDSVLEQTYDNIEIIIVNDGSTDELTNELLSNYTKDKTRVITIHNSGPSKARNIAISQANGEYILPLDADDVIDPTYIKKSVNILDDNDDIGVVYCEAAYIGVIEGKWELPPFSERKILGNNMVFNCALYRKYLWSIVGGYNSNMKNGYEDWDFWLSLVERKVNFFRIPEILFYYRQHNILSRNNKIKNTTEVYLRLKIIFNHPIIYLKNIKSLKTILKYMINIFK
jgi:glycosyltransferase involved in cell wall biosynthesis